LQGYNAQGNQIMTVIVAKASQTVSSSTMFDIDFEALATVSSTTTKEKCDLVIAFSLALVLGLIGAAVSIGSCGSVLHGLGL
jgi:hypothetical protein